MTASRFLHLVQSTCCLTSYTECCMVVASAISIPLSAWHLLCVTCDRSTVGPVLVANCFPGNSANDCFVQMQSANCTCLQAHLRQPALLTQLLHTSHVTCWSLEEGPLPTASTICMSWTLRACTGHVRPHRDPHQPRVQVSASMSISQHVTPVAYLSRKLKASVP